MMYHAYPYFTLLRSYLRAKCVDFNWGHPVHLLYLAVEQYIYILSTITIQEMVDNLSTPSLKNNDSNNKLLVAV